MKKFFLIIFLILPILSASALEKSIQIDPVENFSQEELSGVVNGVCMGSGSYCVYGDGSYVIYADGKRECISLEHPAINNNIPHIKAVFFHNGEYIAIVYDSSVKKSYFVSDMMGDIKYSKLVDIEYEKAAYSSCGIYVVGQRKGIMWVGMLSFEGKLIWEQLGYIRGFFFQNCACYNDKLYAVAREHWSPNMLISVFNAGGKREFDVKLKFTDVFNADKKTLLNANVCIASSNGIYLAGNLVPLRKPSFAYTMHFDLEGNLLDSSTYKEYTNIVSAFNSNQFLAENKKHQYLIDKDNTILIDSKNYKIFGILENMNEKYAYGINIIHPTNSFFAKFH